MINKTQYILPRHTVTFATKSHIVVLQTNGQLHLSKLILTVKSLDGTENIQSQINRLKFCMDRFIIDYSINRLNRF